MDTAKFVFFDETAAKTNMTRLYGRSLFGERLVASAPHGHWKTTTFVAGLSIEGIVAPAVFDGPINAETFLAYVEQVVAPCLRPGQTAVMDNLAAHKTPPSRRRSAPPALRSYSPRPTRRTSTRSRSSSPSSKPICARFARGQNPPLMTPSPIVARR
jgi:hypothetical protein